MRRIGEIVAALVIFSGLAGGVWAGWEFWYKPKQEMAWQIKHFDAIMAQRKLSDCAMGIYEDADNKSQMLCEVHARNRFEKAMEEANK